MARRKAPEARLFRLHGELGGEPRVFVLGPGENRVGADPANPIHLPVRQVSRRHAVLRVQGDSVQVEDLGSTNGTFVNGVRVRSARLGEHDWVQFGPVLLTFEELEAGEHELAITLDDRPRTPPPANRREERTTEVGIRPQGAVPWGEVLAACAERLISRWHPDLEDAVARLAAATGASAVAVLSRAASDEVVVHAACGDLAPLALDHLSAELAALWPGEGGSGGVRCAELAGPVTLSAAVAGGPEGWEAALVLAGRGIRPAEHPFLELALRLFRSATVPVPENGRAAAAPTERDLVFPEWHVVGSSPVMTALYRQLATLRRGNIPVLVTGETGVGKEHVVRILHASSDRAAGPLQIVNCTAIPADLLEAELFGIEAGVATGVSRRRGKLRLAHGGFLFLDEIGDMDPALQAKLLRALQEGEVHPLGASSPVTVDVRVVAATNTDLEQRVRDGRFRRDLFYRIAGCEVAVPPLRRRREDIPALAAFFLERAARDSGKRVRGLSLSALQALQAAAWPGNVRQLQRELTRLVAACPAGGTIESALISPALLAETSPEEPVPAGGLELKLQLAALERRLVVRALDATGGNRSEAARLLGITRNGLAMKMKRLGIEAPPNGG
ncbi:MAG: sigma 54-interacting transcriptional regulator [Thermoanaerobaculales bacterium]|jgi:DNA-binding NtrC family response regulator|nr:sigma 54-interacting transcriptional regulator [Thermoanaerobaculales bacterium]